MPILLSIHKQKWDISNFTIFHRLKFQLINYGVEPPQKNANWRPIYPCYVRNEKRLRSLIVFDTNHATVLTHLSYGSHLFVIAFLIRARFLFVKERSRTTAADVKRSHTHAHHPLGHLAALCERLQKRAC